MNIINRLTLRNLKKNKSRTLVTIIGVVISVAMLTAVSTLTVSFMDLMQKQEMENSGEWHVQYNHLNADQISAIKKDDDIDDVVLSRDRGYARLEGSENVYKPYLFIKSYNKQGFESFPINLDKGRLPKNPDEVVISKHIRTNANVSYNVGDTLKLDVGERIGKNGSQLKQDTALQTTETDKSLETLKNTETKTFKVVGMMERPSFEPLSAPGYTLVSGMDQTNAYQLNASVTFKNVDNDLFNRAEQLAADQNIDMEDIRYHDELLRYYGVTDDDNLQDTFYSLAAIIITIIVIGSVSLIYNAFAISVAERSRHLGMLSSVGATKKQKRNSVFFEGGVIGLIGIPIGVISGLLGIGITFYFINSLIQNAFDIEQNLTVVVTPWSIITACLVSIVTIFLSTYIPARRASKMSAIDAIRQSTDVKLSRKKVKTSKLTRKLFGIEAEIGLKNLKRNRGRYRVTVFSLAISIILFLSVSFFTTNLQKSFELTQKDMDYDIRIIKTTNSEMSNQFVDNVSSLDHVTQTTFIKRLDVRTLIPKASLPDDLKKNATEDDFDNGKYSYLIKLHALDDKSLKRYAKQVGTNYNQLTDPDHSRAIVVDTSQYRDQSGKFVQEKSIHTETGKKLNLIDENPQTDETIDLGTVTIDTLTDQRPVGVDPAGEGLLSVIISKQTMNHLTSSKASNPLTDYMYLSSSDPIQTQTQIEEMQGGSLHIYNNFQDRQKEEQMTLLLSVFVYGFIALIIAISVANIFNTISTSVALRKREFAMLKSVGMTPKSFNKMINYESLFYGIKSLIYGLPVSVGIMYLIHLSLMNTFDYAFTLPWLNILYVVIGVFVIVGSAMLYSSAKVKKENIIETLKQENI